MKNNTFSGNSAPIGGGIYLESTATLNLANTIVANTVGGSDCYNVGGDTIGTNTNNLIETNSAVGHKCGTPTVTGDPVLGPLALNGGTHPQLAAAGHFTRPERGRSYNLYDGAREQHIAEWRESSAGSGL